MTTRAFQNILYANLELKRRNSDKKNVSRRLELFKENRRRKNNAMKIL